MSDQASDESDDDFDRLSDFSDLSLSDAGTDDQDAPQSTPATTPSSSSFRQQLPGSRQKKHACTYENCSKSFHRPARLEEHLRSHTNERIFKCQYQGCDKAYLRDSHLKHHVKSAHTKIRDYNCTWEGCDKSFATGSRLKNHLATHEGHEKFRCRGFGDCRQTFRKKDTLQRHVVSIHLGAKPFPCPESDCSKAFLTAEHLRQHQRVNHDPHRYSCDICLEAIEQDQLLSNLGKRQKREEAYFASWTKFQLHNQQVHPPTCYHCNQAFQTNKQLTHHLENKHAYPNPNGMAEETFPCSQPGCKSVLTSAKSLNLHQKIHLSREDRPIKCTGTIRVYQVPKNKLKILADDETAPEGIEVETVEGCDKWSDNYNYQLIRHLQGPSHMDLNTRNEGATKRKGFPREPGIKDVDGYEKFKKAKLDEDNIEAFPTRTGTVRDVPFAKTDQFGNINLVWPDHRIPMIDPNLILDLDNLDGGPPPPSAPTDNLFPVIYDGEMELLDNKAQLTGDETMLGGEILGEDADFPSFDCGSGLGPGTEVDFVAPGDLHLRPL